VVKDNMVNKTESVILVDDDPQVLLSSSVLLRSASIAADVKTFCEGESLMVLLDRDAESSVLVLDLGLPGGITGEDLLGVIKTEYPDLPVIVMTAQDDLETAVRCMKAGAFDYLVKPVEDSRFVTAVRRAVEVISLKSELGSLKERLFSEGLQDESAFSHIVTASPRMHAVFKYVEAIAGTPQPVLVVGETGAGKELIARAIHQASRRSGEFVAVNVAGLDDTMLSDTLFGHRKGAYTGAVEQREGLIARARGGSLFLDEIGDLNEASQVKLLRLLQEQRYYPLGSDVARYSDSHVVVATNRDLRVLMSEGGFRKDLYYRLRGHLIDVAPLRERPEDIGLLLEYFLEKAARQLGKRKPSYPRELPVLLRTYHFPGNVRELQSMVYDAVARHRSGVLSMGSFRETMGRESLFGVSSEGHSGSIKELFQSRFEGRFPTLKEADEYLMEEAMRVSGGNQGVAASLLGLTRQALNKRLIRRNKR